VGKKLHLREIVFEYEEENKWNSSEDVEILKLDSTGRLAKFEKIKHRPKHSLEEYQTIIKRDS